MIDHITTVGRALSDPGRVRILLALLHNTELCACELARMLALTPATVSRHMEILRDTGFVSARKDGKWVHYGLAENKLPTGMADWLTSHGEKDPQYRKDRKGHWKNKECEQCPTN